MENVEHVILGRENKEATNYFQIGANNTISKQHAKIFWDQKQHCFKIQNLSKNKVSIDF